MKKEKKRFDFEAHYYLMIILIAIASAVICYFIGWCTARELIWRMGIEIDAGLVGMLVASLALGASITLNIMFLHDEL